MPKPLRGKLNYSESVAKKMEKTFQMHKNVQPFSGCFYLTNLFYLYLFKKYKIGCVITNYSNGIEFLFNFKNKELISVHDEYIETNCDNIFECIKRGEKIIIIPFMFQITINQKMIGSHANLLIYRQNTSQLEHFEPHGAEYGGIKKKLVNDSINSVLLKLVELLNEKIRVENVERDEYGYDDDEMVKEVTLIKAQDVCPVFAGGLQALEQASTIPKNALIEPGGYCTSWSMFFTELCLKNPEIPSRLIHEAIMEKTELYDNKNDYLRNVIRGYTCFINNKIAKHFTHVFGEPISSVKIHRMVGKVMKNESELAEITDYGDKLFEIMEVETGRTIPKTNSYPEVKDRYIEFIEGIQSETSSSSVKSENRISSPKRVSPNSKTKKSASLTETVTATKMDESGMAKGKMKQNVKKRTKKNK
jgi:hypothetical protein